MKKIAFISQEFSIEKLPTYAGGLGILAGDILYTANDFEYPFYGVTFVNKGGYAQYKIIDNEIRYEEEFFDPLEYFLKIDEKFHLDLKDLRIYFNVWLYNLPNAKLFLIDTDVPENEEKIRKLTRRLYYEDDIEEKILKDLLLSLAPLVIFEKLDIKIDKYHINESHAGFLPIELLKRYKNIEEVKKMIVFTTHSPIAGIDEFDYNLVEKYYNIPDDIKNISGDKLSLTKILLHLSGYSNAVSYKHKFVTEKLWGMKIDYITNGVYHIRWVNEKLASLYDIYLPNWRKEPTVFAYAKYININEFRKVKEYLKENTVEYINTNGYLNKKFENDRILISVKRRFTEYKRFHMILWRLEKLEELNRKYKIQVLISGVWHPKDEYTKNAIKWIIDIMSTLSTPVALILRRGYEQENYILSGSDLFLHIPRPPFEASGTSWMRAGINGTPTLFSRDGSAVEAIIDDYNGWFFGSERKYPDEPYNEDLDIENFYNKLDYILNLYRNEKEKYLDVSLNAIKTIGSLFNSYRMFKEYISKAYRT